MFEFLTILLLLIVIIVILIVGLFVKPAMDKEKNYYDDEDYDYDEEDDNYTEDFEIEEEELPSTIGYRRRKTANEVTLSKTPSGQTLLQIKCSTLPEFFPVSESSEIVLKVDPEGILVDYYLPRE